MNLDHLTPDRQAAVRQYAATRHHDVRAAQPVPTPAWVNAYADRTHQEKLAKAKEAYARTGRWYYIEDPGDHKKRWDEVSTATVYNQLADALGLENLPGYSPENHRAAIAWWHSWQNVHTGRFYNPLVVDPQHPPDPMDFCNEKYVVGMLTALGDAPLYPFSTISAASEAGAVDVDYFYRQTSDLSRDGGGSWAGMMCKELMALIEQGQTQYIAVLERGIGNLLRLQSPATGLWSSSDDYAEYGTTADALKILGRLHYMLGAEHLPHMNALADTLIRHQKAMQSKRDSVLRNTGELLTICLETSDYRREELLDTIKQHTAAFQNHLGTNYSVYGLGLMGAYLHWCDCKFPNPACHFSRGMQWSHRIVVQADLSVRLVDKMEAAP